MIEIGNYVFLAIAVIFGVLAAHSDLKYMTIPNKLVLQLVATFLVAGVIFLPFVDVFLWRLLGGFVILVIGFILFSLRGFGGGDAKYAAAIALFIPSGDAGYFMFILSLSALFAVVTHRMVLWFSFADPITKTWKSWNARRNFPLGLGLSIAFIFYLTQQAFSFL